MENKRYIDCLCESPDHVIRISYDDDDCWIEVQLNYYLPWYKRAWNALRYVFGAQPKWGGHWDATLLDERKANEVRNLLDDYILFKDARPRGEDNPGHVDINHDNGRTRVHLLADMIQPSEPWPRK